jgi:hypothetical protein
MKTFGSVKILLNSELNGDKWSVSSPSRFTSRERAPCTLRVGGVVGPQIGSGRKRKEKNGFPIMGIITHFLGCSSRSHCTNRSLVTSDQGLYSTKLLQFQYQLWWSFGVLACSKAGCSWINMNKRYAIDTLLFVTHIPWQNRVIIGHKLIIFCTENKRIVDLMNWYGSLIQVNMTLEVVYLNRYIFKYLDAVLLELIWKLFIRFLFSKAISISECIVSNNRTIGMNNYLHRVSKKWAIRTFEIFFCFLLGGTKLKVEFVPLSN